MDMLGSAWNGINSSLFMIGVTGTGKSYTLYGDTHNKGVLFMTLEHMFTRISQQRKLDKRYIVDVSMFNIYN
jgi:hypothetical protein